MADEEVVEITAKGIRDKIVGMFEDVDGVTFCDSYVSPINPKIQAVRISFVNGTCIEVNVNEVDNFKNNWLYRCSTKIKCPRYFRCSFNGSDLNAGIDLKPKDCPAERISLVDSGVKENKATINKGADYKYLVSSTYDVTETAFAFNSLIDAKSKLREVGRAKPDEAYFIWEMYEKSSVGGKAFKKIFAWEGESIVDRVDGGLHIEWLLELKTVVRCF